MEDQFKELKKSIANEINNKAQHLREAQISDDKIEELRQRLERLSRNIHLSNKENIVITDHAMVRIMERVFEVSLQEIKQQVIKELTPYVKFSRDGKFPVLDSKFKAVVKDGVVVTVM